MTDDGALIEAAILPLQTMPEYFESSLAAVSASIGPPRGGPWNSVVVFAPDSCGVVAQTVVAIATYLVGVPVVLADGYEIPPFVNNHTLFIVMSLDPSSAPLIDLTGTAAAAGASIAVLADRSGDLADRVASWDATYVPTTTDTTSDPVMLAGVLVPTVALLEDAGLLAGGRFWLRTAADELKRRRDDTFATDNGIELPWVEMSSAGVTLAYGCGCLGGAAARHCKVALNRFAKMPAFWNGVPQLSHDELYTWGHIDRGTRQKCSVLLLRHDFEHPLASRTMSQLSDRTKEYAGGTTELRARGESEVAQLVDLQYTASIAAVRLGIQRGVDPWEAPSFSLEDEVPRS